MPDREQKGREGPQGSSEPASSCARFFPARACAVDPFLEASETVALPKVLRHRAGLPQAEITPMAAHLPNEIISSLEEHNLHYLSTLAVAKGAVVVRCTRDAMEVAVKITSETPTSFSGAILEARLQSLAAHPHVLPVISSGFLAARHQYAIFPYLNGSLASLRSQVTDNEFENTLLVHSLAILSALDCVHEMGMVHRDVKPSNILLAYFQDVDGQPQSYPFLSDFGIAKPLDSDVREKLRQVTQLDVEGKPTVELLSLRRTHNSIRGTPGYISPEQARGEDVDRRSDIFSMGIVLYTGYLGQNPYQVAFSEPRRMIAQAAAQGLPAIQQRVSGMDPKIAAIINRAVAFKREDRFRTAQEMAVALGHTVRNRFRAPSDTWSATVESLIFNQ